MPYVVELRYIGGDLASLSQDMLAWFDRNRIRPEEFHHATAPPGLSFRIEFRDHDDAAAFAKAFDGWLQGTDPQGGGRHWTTPPLAPRTRSCPTPAVKSARSHR